MIIAIDGPAASGKSTTARLVARKLGITYLDTGAMYRSVTLALLQRGIAFSDIPAINDLISSLSLDLFSEKGVTEVRMDGKDVSDAIRSTEVTENVSAVSAIHEVRLAMVNLQQRIGQQSDCVVEGRDIGTVVFPAADYKFFLVADSRTRALRRQKDLELLGESKSLEELIEEIEIRDKKDSSREHSPLQKADDAIELDTSSLTIDEQVAFIVQTINP